MVEKYMKDYSLTLCLFRLEQAERCIKSAKLLLNEADYNGAANRSYYAVFHCMRAILATDEVDFKRHSGVIAYFRKEYIKTGKFDTSISEWIAELFDIRSFSDYQDFYLVTKEAILIQVQRAEQFYTIVREYLQKIGIILKP